MAISGVYFYQDDTEIMLMESISKKLKLLLAQSIGRWSMTYKLYIRLLKQFYIVSLSYHPGILFCKSHQTSVEVNGDFEQMIIKTKLWNMRQMIQIEGDVYEINNFIIRLANTDKGIIINIECITCDTIAEGQIIMQNFLAECLIPAFKDTCIRSSYNLVSSSDKKSNFTSGFQFIDVLK
ncbi:hypothetical protein PCK1_000562 [Pneumocystis canis]|nr:hypothetical protein PCK1_000562 [Pneumocystis canis]